MLHLLKYQRCSKLRPRARAEAFGLGKSRKFSGLLGFTVNELKIKANLLLSVQADYKRLAYGQVLNGHTAVSSGWKKMTFDDLFGDVSEVVVLQDTIPHDINLDDLFSEEPPKIEDEQNGDSFPFDDPVLGEEVPAEDILSSAAFSQSSEPEAVFYEEEVISQVSEPEYEMPTREPEPEFLESDLRTSKSGSKSPRTLLIDASPIVHAAYHRLDVLTAPGTSIPVHGIYGFMRKLLFYMKTYEYDYIGLCLDSSKSFRKDIFPGYKANRSPQDAVCLFFAIHTYLLAPTVPIRTSRRGMHGIGRIVDKSRRL